MKHRAKFRGLDGNLVPAVSRSFDRNDAIDSERAWDELVAMAEAAPCMVKLPLEVVERGCAPAADNPDLT